MDRLIRHIELLLYQHDCVIIPEFGGFVLQTVPALYLGEEHSFSPASKEIVFNPTLTYNDGLLSHAYMLDYSIDYAKAQQLVKTDVSQIKDELNYNAEYQMGKVGAFVKDGNRIVYMPDNESDNLFSTSTFGLPVFYYLPLARRLMATEAPKPAETVAQRVEYQRYEPVYQRYEPEPQRIEIRRPVVAERTYSTEKSYPTEKNYSLQRNTLKGSADMSNKSFTTTVLQVLAVAAAAIIIFLLVSIPVGDVNKSSYTASFMPEDIIPKSSVPESSGVSASVSTSSAAASETVVNQDVITPSATTAPPASTAEVKTSSEETAKTTENRVSSKASSASTFASKPYFVIIGSFANRQQANNYIKRLGAKEKATAGILVRDGRVRVYAQHFANETQAQRYIKQLHNDPKHRQAWLYTYK